MVPAVVLTGGAEMPLVGFGTWELRRARAYEAVRRALESGYRHIDTATMYGNEAEVGKALRDSGLDRSEVFVTTKLPPGNTGRERQTLNDSLRALDSDYVDLWLIHWPGRRDELVPTWRHFLDARDEGRAKAVGVSNYSPAQIDRLIEETGQAPEVNQIPWSPPMYDQRLVAAHRERGVAIEGYSPLKGTDLRHPVLAAIASHHGVSPAQVVLRWHVEHEITVIPKSARPERISANFDLFGFSLTEEEVARIDNLSAN